jgi:hypothetical protein
VHLAILVHAARDYLDAQTEDQLSDLLAARLPHLVMMYQPSASQQHVESVVMHALPMLSEVWMKQIASREHERQPLLLSRLADRLLAKADLEDAEEANAAETSETDFVDVVQSPHASSSAVADDGAK